MNAKASDIIIANYTEILQWNQIPRYEALI